MILFLKMQIESFYLKKTESVNLSIINKINDFRVKLNLYAKLDTIYD